MSLNRIWSMGSTTSGSSGTFPAFAKAFWGFPGINDDSYATRFGYPFTFSDDKICEICFRYLQLRIDIDYSLSWANPGTDSDPIDPPDLWTSTGTYSGLITSLASDEETVNNIALGPNDGAKWAGNIDGSRTETKNGVTQSPDTTSRFMELNVMTQTILILDQYGYRPTTELWIPSFQAKINFENNEPSPPPISGPGSLYFGVDSLVHPDSIPDAYEIGAGDAGSFLGQTFDFVGHLNDTITLDSFSMVITPVFWWEYDGIWDTTTGLLNPGQTNVTQVGI